MIGFREEIGIPALRRDAEERFRDRVFAAKLRFDLAVALSAQALGDPNVSDAGPALEMEQDARNEYQRELQVFTDLVVRGKMPGDETPT